MAELKVSTGGKDDAGATLDTLPDEVLIAICRYLKVKDLGLGFGMVSRRFRALSEDSALWKALHLSYFGVSSLIIRPGRPLGPLPEPPLLVEEAEVAGHESDEDTEKEDEKWSCLACTFLNAKYNPVCEICDTPKGDVLPPGIVSEVEENGNGVINKDQGEDKINKNNKIEKEEEEVNNNNKSEKNSAVVEEKEEKVKEKEEKVVEGIEKANQEGKGEENEKTQNQEEDKTELNDKEKPNHEEIRWKNVFAGKARGVEQWGIGQVEVEILPVGEALSDVCHNDRFLCYAGGSNKVVPCYSLSRRTIVKRYPSPISSSHAVQFDESMDLLVGAHEGKLSINKFSTAEIIHASLPNAHSGRRVWHLQFDHEKLVSVGDGDLIVLNDIRTGLGLPSPTRSHTGGVRSLAFVGDVICTGGGFGDNSVKIWDFRAMAEPQASLPQMESGAWCLDLEDDKLLCGSRYDFHLWDIGMRKPVHKFTKAHNDHIDGVKFADFGIISVGHDGVVRVWDGRTFEPKWTRDVGVKSIWSSCHYGSLLALASGESKLVLVRPAKIK